MPENEDGNQTSPEDRWRLAQQVSENTGTSNAIGNTSSVPKLNGKNFQSWKEIVELILELRGLKGALTTQESGTKGLQAKLTLLETMDESHRTQVRGCVTAKEIMDRLCQVYADKSASNLYRMLYAFFRYKKPYHDSISEHVGKLSEMRAGLADIGESISEALFQVTLIGSLPPEFNFLEVWEMAHPDMRTTQNLIGRLLKREEDMKNTDTGNKVFISSQRPGALAIEQLKKTTTCHNCGKVGHWKAECKARRSAERKHDDSPRGNVMFTLGKLGTKLKRQWVIDTGASAHMCNEQSWFCKLELLETSEECQVGNGSKVQVTGIGQVKLMSKVSGNVHQITLNRVLLIPELAANLVSVGAAVDKGITAHFMKDICNLNSGEDLVAMGKQIDEKLYLLDAKVLLPQRALMVNGERSMGQWHQVLGHAGKEKIASLLRDKELGLTLKNGNSEDEECGICPAGKGRHVSHPTRKTPRSEVVGHTLHTDLSGKVNKETLDGENYYLLCKDEFSEHCKIFLLKGKNETAPALAQAIIETEVETGHMVKEVVSDNGSEFVNETTKLLFLKEGIVHNRSAAYTPQQNGLVEREMQTITNMARTLLLASGMPKQLWGMAINTACYIKNRLPTSKSPLSPFERYYGRKPYLKNMAIFGQPVHIIVNNQYLTKFDSRTKEGYFVGYTKRANTYKIYIPESNRVIETADVIFTKHSSHLETNATREEVDETITLNFWENNRGENRKDEKGASNNEGRQNAGGQKATEANRRLKILDEYFRNLEEKGLITPKSESQQTPITSTPKASTSQQLSPVDTAITPKAPSPLPERGQTSQATPETVSTVRNVSGPPNLVAETPLSRRETFHSAREKHSTTENTQDTSFVAMIPKSWEEV